MTVASELRLRQRCSVNLHWEKLCAVASAEVEATVSALPEPLRARAEKLPVTLERQPNMNLQADGIEPDTLGLFTGAEFAEEGNVPLPPQIVLFLGNLWDFAEEDEVIFREEVRTIAFHIDIGTYSDRLLCMKAYALDLRKRVVKFVNDGGSKAEAARRFSLGRRTVYRYLAAAQTGTLAPKKSWGHWRKLDPQKLQAQVKDHPDATLKELQRVFGVSHHAVWVRLRQLGFTLKKTHKLSRTQRGATLALPARTGKPGRHAGILPGRMRRGSPSVS